MEDSIYLDLVFCGNGQLPEQPLQEPAENQNAHHNSSHPIASYLNW